MVNRKFQLLMGEFAQLAKGNMLKLDNNQSLVCHYQQQNFHLEDGERIGLSQQLVILAPFAKKITAKQQQKLNGDFALTKDGYLCEIAQLGSCYVVHLALPEHPQQLFQQLDELVKRMKKLNSEINDHVVA